MPKSQLAKIVHAQAEGKSYSEAAQEVAWTKDKAQKQAQRAQLGDFPKPLKVLPNEITLEGDYIIVSDLHVNAARRDLIELVAEYAVKMGIRKIALVGDLFNFDIFSVYPALVCVDAMETEIAAARSILVYWLQFVDEIAFCRGNHDERVIKKFEGHLDMDGICDLMIREQDGPGLRGRVHPTMHDRLWLNTSNGQWLLAHQKEYSQQTLTVANKLALKYHCNVVTAHQHHFGMGVSKYGGFVIADNPCMCDPDQIAYKKLNTNSMPDWAFGFSMIKDGSYIPYVDKMPLGIKL